MEAVLRKNWISRKMNALARSIDRVSPWYDVRHAHSQIDISARD